MSGHDYDLTQKKRSGYLPLGNFWCTNLLIINNLTYVFKQYKIKKY